MENATLMTLAAILLPIFGAGVGYLIKHNIEKKKDLISEVTKTRRALYQKYIDLVVDVLHDSKEGKMLDQNLITKEFYSFYKQYILYASPDVINAFGDYYQFTYQRKTEDKFDHKVHTKNLTRIFSAMRKDLGLKNKKLGKDGEKLFRALLTDYDQFM